MKNITILFTGQYRSKTLFLKTLHDINLFKNKYNIKIIFSTWSNEVNSDTKNILKKYDVEILEFEEKNAEKIILNFDKSAYHKSRSSCRGNTIPHVNAWKTMILYDNGLKHIENGNFVF